MEGARKLLPLPPCTAHLSSPGRHNELDVGVLVLPARQLGRFQKRVFLAGPEIDQNNRPHDQGLAWFYFVLGYSAARTQVKVSRAPRLIHPRPFHCSTNPVDAAEYLRQGMSQADHVLLDFGHKVMVIGSGGSIHPNCKELAAGAFFTFPQKPSSARWSLLVGKIDAIPGSLWARESSISWRWSVN
jgi:hypothetical protein